MDFFMLFVGIALMAFGFLGCFINRIPGALISFIGILTLHFGTDVKFSTEALVLVGILTLVATLVAKHIPNIVSRIHEIGKPGKWGSIIGSIGGIIIIANAGVQVEVVKSILLYVTAFGILPFGFAFLFEFASQKNMKEALMTASASYVSYLLSVLLNLGICCYGVYTAFTN